MTDYSDVTTTELTNDQLANRLFRHAQLHWYEEAPRGVLIEAADRLRAVPESHGPVGELTGFAVGDYSWPFSSGGEKYQWDSARRYADACNRPVTAIIDGITTDRRVMVIARSDLTPIFVVDMGPVHPEPAPEPEPEAPHVVQYALSGRNCSTLTYPANDRLDVEFLKFRARQYPGGVLVAHYSDGTATVVWPEKVEPEPLTESSALWPDGSTSEAGPDLQNPTETHTAVVDHTPDPLDPPADPEGWAEAWKAATKPATTVAGPGPFYKGLVDRIIDGASDSRNRTFIDMPRQHGRGAAADRVFTDEPTTTWEEGYPRFERVGWKLRIDQNSSETMWIDLEKVVSVEIEDNCIVVEHEGTFRLHETLVECPAEFLAVSRTRIVDIVTGGLCVEPPFVTATQEAYDWRAADEARRKVQTTLADVREDLIRIRNAAGAMNTIGSSWVLVNLNGLIDRCTL